jgi:hypothetical protein
LIGRFNFGSALVFHDLRGRWSRRFLVQTFVAHEAQPNQRLASATR